MTNLIAEEAYSFDDVLLVPSYSDVLPKDVDTRTRLTRELTLNIPIVSAAMDTVTEAQTAITMAREGGIGFIHRNMSVKHQAMEVDQVKKSESGMIVDPLTIGPDRPIEEVMKLMGNLNEFRKSGMKFDIRIYAGPKTYNQVSLNNDNMALIIAEDPVTATWITRDFNPDLIDNAVKAFDRDWKKSKSFLELTPKDLQAFGGEPGGLISKITKTNGEDQSDVRGE